MKGPDQMKLIISITFKARRPESERNPIACLSDEFALGTEATVVLLAVFVSFLPIAVGADSFVTLLEAKGGVAEVD